MENLEKNDSTKDLSLNASSDESVGKQSDEAGIEEKEILKTDTSVEDALSQDVQNESDGPVEIRETDETPVENRETDETPVEVRETDETPVEIRETDETPVEIRETDETPVEVRETDETPVEIRETDETPVEIRETDEIPVEVRETDETPVEVREAGDSLESVQKPSEQSEPDQEPSVSPEKVQKPADDMESLMDMYEESFKRFAEGAVVTGRIISVDKDHVLVDIGYKSEGQIRTQEFMDEDGNLNANVGDPVDVMVEWWDDEEERVVLSKEKAAKVKIWEEIKKAYEEERTVEGIIINRVKGGFSVDIGVQAFLPGSQADLRPIRKLDEMVGKTFTFKILKYNRKRSNIVLSRRAILEEERSASRTATLASIHEGKVVEGIIKNITEYGVFVDLGGVDGLLHITDISWGRVKHPSELFSVGDKITVKVLNLDLEKERVSLGKKQLTEDPWLTASEKYPVGSRIIGRVVSLTDYGAFVELEEGIEGLIHVSEMSWTRKIRHPSKVVSVGEEVEAVVLDIRPENRRISLGMKQVVPNPWDVISEKYPVGTTIEGKIKNITDFGLFIGIGEGIDGLVHISDISWTKRIKHPSELYKKNDVIQAIVLDIEKDQERFSLGVKQLQTDPWKTVGERYEVGKEITGTVTNLTDFGVFVELEEGIEGLVHVSEISKEKVKTPVGKFNIGDVITARVMNINSVERRIGLSIKRLEIEDEQSLLTEYVNNVGPATSTFGEILRENLQEKLNDDN